MSDFRLNQDDVTVQEIPDDECDECTVGPTTHAVTIDFRSAGMVHTVGFYCHRCADEIAARIRAGLPCDLRDGGVRG